MNGVTEPIMLARGFTLAMLGILVRKRLAIVRWKPVRAGGKTIEVGRFRITDVGRGDNGCGAEGDRGMKATPP
jgi:hypothetical protein